MRSRNSRKFVTVSATLAFFASSPVQAESQVIPEPEWRSSFTVPVDHFSASKDKPSFQIRTLGYSKFAKLDGPIFFYSGNEGSIDSFWKNTGLPFAWAEEFGADIVFAEHRYYGESLPFGEDTFKTPEHMQYLRVEQTLADYAMFMKYYQESKGTKKRVMVHGGSYGGIIAAFLRQKYPTVFHMAIAASAPIPQIFNMVGGGRSPATFYTAVTHDARMADVQCPVKVQEAFAIVEKKFKSGEDLEYVQKKFNLCAKPTSKEWSHFMQYTRNAWTSMAMCDYPYPTDFLAKLPAWPIKAACKAVADAGDDVVQGLADAVSLPYATGDGACLDMYKLFIECADQTGCGAGNDANAWDYQMCADITIIVESNNKTDMFPERAWTVSSLVDYCLAKYGTQPNPTELSVRLGAFAFEDSPGSYTNIIFSNGLLDPWHPGGYLDDLSDSVVAIKIPLGAHHLDLRMANEADPKDVIEARNLEKAYAHKWLKTGRYPDAELEEQIAQARKQLQQTTERGEKVKLESSPVKAGAFSQEMYT